MKLFGKFIFKNFTTQNKKSQRIIGFPPLIICGPSGSGKTCLVKHILNKYPDHFSFSISYTTREQRENEKHGFDYFFVEKTTFEEEIANKNFLEYNLVHGNYYGTYRPQIESIISKDKIALMDIDIQGVRQVSKNGLIQSYKIFVEPPSLEELKVRLQNRNSETPDTLLKRLANASKEIRLAHQINIFHKFLMNDNKEQYLTEATELIESWYPFIKMIVNSNSNLS